MVGGVLISEAEGCFIHFQIVLKYNLLISASPSCHSRCTISDTVKGLFFPLGLEHLSTYKLLL